MSPEEYFDIIRLYLSDMINDHKTQSDRKIPLTMSIKFISSKDSNETRIMHTKSDNIEIMMGSKTYDIIDELRESFTKLSKRFRRIYEKK